MNISTSPKRKKKTQIQEILKKNLLTKRIRKKKLIKDKVQIENTDMK